MKKVQWGQELVFVLSVVCLCSVAGAGDLNPSSPPTAGTMKPLDQVEPRTAVQTLSGNTSSTYVITQSGSYYLTGNIYGSIGRHVLEITADNVTVDLCGFTMTGGIVMIGQTCHGVYMSGRKNVEIRNGTIQNCVGHGICDLSAAAQGHRIQSIRARNNSFHGIYLKGKGHLVKECTAMNNSGPGIYAGYPSAIEDCFQGDNNDGMLRVEGGGCYFQGNEEWAYVPAFYIARYETTNGQYCEFLNEVGARGEYYYSTMEIVQSGSPGQYSYVVQTGRENYPMRFVCFYEAQAYAEWKRRVTGLPYRLPTKQEWEKAAGWNPALWTGWTYGFQRDTIDSTWCNYNNAYGGPLAVGSFNGTGGKNDARSWYGCYDMSGNIAEMVNRMPDSAIPATCGGNWASGEFWCAIFRENSIDAYSRNQYAGFRLVRDVE